MKESCFSPLEFPSDYSYFSMLILCVGLSSTEITYISKPEDFLFLICSEYQKERNASRPKILFTKESSEVIGKAWGFIMKEVVGWVGGRSDTSASRLSLMFYRV